MAQLLSQLPTNPPQKGVTTFANINNIAQTLATDFAGNQDPAAGTEPLAPWPYCRWADTQNGVMKRRNPTNTGWVVVGRLLSAHAPMMTFAEVISLTQDMGPIIVSDMDGQLYTWHTSAYFVGYRGGKTGEYPNVLAMTPRAWEVEAIGGVWSMSDPKERRLITYLQEQGLTCAVGDWIAGQGKIADLGNGDWKAIDAQNMFLRRAGTDADTANPMGPGEYQADASQRVTGTLGFGENGFATVATGAFVVAQASVVTPSFTSSPSYSKVNFDTGLVTRAATETRGAATRVTAVITI